MLERVMRYIHNRFECDSAREGVFTAPSAMPELLEGQYYWIEGSVLNDGLHRHPADDLEEETFRGRIVPLAVPRAVVELAEEIEDWCYENSKALNSPYQSESFGGYSYSKGGYGGGGTGPGMGGEGWQEHFGPRLRQWRKLSSDWQ